MKKILLLLLVLFSFIPVTSADVTFYGDTTLYLNDGDISVTFVDSGITVYYCEFQDTSNYILLENLNLTMTCTGSLLVNVSEVNSSINLTSGTTVLRFNATYSGSSVVFGFDGNHSNAFYDVYVNSVRKVHNSNMDSFSFTQSSWSKKDIDIRLAGYYPDPPYDGASHYNTSDNKLNFSWTRGNYSDCEVLVKNNNSYPSSPSDGTEVYNGTDLYYNFTNFDSGYYTVWSFNDTTDTFSRTGEDIPWGAINITVYNESQPWVQISPFGLLISNQDVTSTYQNSSCTNPHTLDLLDIPYGSNTVIYINATDYRHRTYYKDLLVNTFYNYSFYLPPLETTVDPGGGDEGGSGDNYSTTTAFTVTVVDEYGYFLNDVKIIISRYMNNTGEYEEIASQITDGIGDAQFMLIPNVKHYVELVKDGYVQEGSKFWTPLLDNYGNGISKELSMSLDASNIENVTFWDVCHFNGTMYSNGSLYVQFEEFSDDDTVTNASFYTYEVFNFTESLNATNTTTDESFSFWVTGINTSRVHRVVCYINHSDFGSDIVSIWIQPLRTPNKSRTDIENKLTGSLGSNPLGWVNLLILFIPILVLLLVFGPSNAGIGIMGSGLYVGFASIFISVDTRVLALVPIVVAIGFILIMVKRGRMNL